MTITISTPAPPRRHRRRLRPRLGGGRSPASQPGVLGLAIFGMTGALVDDDAMADNALIAAELTEKAGWVWAYQVLGVATALLVAYFATGVYRRLAQQAPANSLAPMLAVGGLWLVSALGPVGSGISTEMFHGLRQDTDALDPDTLAAQLAGARGYLLKGASPADIQRAVDAVCRGEVLLGPEVATRAIGFLTGSRRDGPTPFPDLTDREREVLDLVAAGLDNASISRRLSVSPKTVRNHLSNVFTKLQVADRSQAIVRAREAGLGLG